MFGMQICCSSPERFLHGNRDGELEARPIKGTAPRGHNADSDAAAAAALAASEKDQAENLMIVDLLRNDLGRVCEVGFLFPSCIRWNDGVLVLPQLLCNAWAECTKWTLPGTVLEGKLHRRQAWPFTHAGHALVA